MEPSFCQNSIRNEIADRLDFKQVHGKGQEGLVKYEDQKGWYYFFGYLCKSQIVLRNVSQFHWGQLAKGNLSCSIPFYPNQELYNEFHRKANRNKLIINLSTNLMNSLLPENKLESNFRLALTSGYSTSACPPEAYFSRLRSLVPRNHISIFRFY